MPGTRVRSSLNELRESNQLLALKCKGPGTLLQFLSGLPTARPTGCWWKKREAWAEKLEFPHQNSYPDDVRHFLKMKTRSRKKSVVRSDGWKDSSKHSLFTFLKMNFHHYRLWCVLSKERAHICPCCELVVLGPNPWRIELGLSDAIIN